MGWASEQVMVSGAEMRSAGCSCLPFVLTLGSVPVTKVWACPQPNLLLPTLPLHMGSSGELIVIFYCNLSNRSPSNLDLEVTECLESCRLSVVGFSGARMTGNFLNEDLICFTLRNK